MLLINDDMIVKDCNLLILRPGLVKIQLRFRKAEVKLFNNRTVLIFRPFQQTNV